MPFGLVEQLMRTAVEERIFPGAVLLIAHKGAVVFEEAYGWADLFDRTPMTTDTFFDLASLTKPLATTMAAMRLVQEELLDLDRPCGAYLPLPTGSDKAALTARQLLTHCAGLPAYRPYYMRLRHLPPAECRAHLTRWLIAEPLSAAPGRRTEYSDLGFLLLQHIIETITGRPLEQYVRDKVYRPLQIERLFFAGELKPAEGAAFAATELCPLRGRLLKGEVHDENAYVIGGVGGHAGLFGTARAVADLLRALWQSDQQGRATVLDPAVVRLFFRHGETNTWALGFDTPSVQGSSAGRYFSSASVGHLGFTGTSFWMDRRRALIVVLLSNRIHPSRYNIKIRLFRPRLHDAVVAALIPRPPLRVV